MKEERLVTLLETLLGRSQSARGGEEAVFHCPKCNHHKKKLTLNKSTQKFQCWVCNFKGHRAFQILKEAKSPYNLYQELKEIDKQYNFKTQHKVEKEEIVSLPEGFTEIWKSSSLHSQNAYNYLLKRKITLQDMIKYNIGYCTEGEFANMVVVPSYDKDGFLNYYVGRSFQKNAYKTHRLPSASKDIIGMEMLINWDLPVILCEGALDAIAIKRNAIPLFGKKIPQILMKKLVTSDVKKVYLALDNDALRDAVKHAEILMNYGKEVYLVEMDDKDPSELGFREFTCLLHEAEPFNFQSLLTKKLAL